MLGNITLRTFYPILVSDFHSIENTNWKLIQIRHRKNLYPKKDINYGIRGLQFMEGIQKLKCNSCGITFMSENNSPLCPTCSENSSAHHHEAGSENSSTHHEAEHGCGCGGH